MSTLSLRHIDKIYDNNVQAVFDFNLEIKDKEFIVLVGPSGCGKSTTLRMVAGLENITDGELYIDGKFVNTVMPKDRDIAMVFQNYALYPHMTVYKNMAFGLTIRKHPIPLLYKSKKIEKVFDKKLNKEVEKEVYEIFKFNELAEIGRGTLTPDMLVKTNYYYDVKKIKELNKEIEKLRAKNNDENALAKLMEELNSLKSNKTVAKEEKVKYQYLDLVRLGIEKLEKEKKANKIPEYDFEAIKNLQMQIKKLNNEDGDHTEIIKHLQEKINELQSKKTVFRIKMVKYTKLEIDEAVKKSAEILGLTRYLDRKPAALSGGQRQRVALGRAIVRQPKVFLMDEPLSNLDAKLRVQMRSEITKIHERVGATTIYVTHDQTEAMTMASRIVIMKDGWVQQIGTPQEVFDDPENIFVGGFIGSPAMNFYEGIFEKGFFYFGEEKKTKMKITKEHLELLKPYESKPIVLGVRPSDVYVKGSPHNHHPSAPVGMLCEIKELLGDEIIVYGNLAGHKTSVKLKAGKEKVDVGDIIEYTFDTTKMYFFDKKSTKRIRLGTKAE